jgi:hypothetical protein
MTLILISSAFGVFAGVFKITSLKTSGNLAPKSVLLDLFCVKTQGFSREF